MQEFKLGIQQMLTQMHAILCEELELTGIQGISEQLIAKAIKKYNIPREKLIILTKCYFPVMDNPLGERYMPNQPENRDYVMKKGNELVSRGIC